MLSIHTETSDSVKELTGSAAAADFLAETVYCDHSHQTIQALSQKYRASMGFPALSLAISGELFII